MKSMAIAGMVLLAAGGSAMGLGIADWDAIRTTTLLNYNTTLTSLPSETAVTMGGQFTFEVVPEPATMLVLASGAALLRRRR